MLAERYLLQPPMEGGSEAVPKGTRRFCLGPPARGHGSRSAQPQPRQHVVAPGFGPLAMMVSAPPVTAP